MRIYDITYLIPNGITQRKYLVDIMTWREVIKPILRQIEDEKELPEKQRDKLKLKALKNELAVVFGGRHLDPFYDIIVEGGRFGRAVETRILDPFFSGCPKTELLVKEPTPMPLGLHHMLVERFKARFDSTPPL